MIKNITKKVEQLQSITQFYCDACNKCEESSSSFSYNSPKGWCRFVKTDETVLNMSELLLCPECFQGKLLPWLESQKKTN